MPWHQTGRPVATTPALSRTTPSVTSAFTPRRTMRMHRMSPKMPAVVTPIASATAMQPSGIASIAARVEIGLRPARRRREILAHRHEAQREGRPDEALACRRAQTASRPLIQQCRMPFFSSIVVMVAVVTFSSVAMTSGERLKGLSRQVWICD